MQKESKIVPASSVPPGGMVLLSLDGTEKSDLKASATIWLLSAAVLGYYLGNKYPMGKR